MATKNEILKALIDTSRNCPLKVKELAQRLEADPLALSVQLHRLSKERFIAKKGGKRGWFISKEGKRRLQILDRPLNEAGRSKEKEFKMKYAAELEEAIKTTEGTNYGKFLEIGKQVGVPANFVLLTADYVWRLGDYRDLVWIWRALGEMLIRKDLRKVWFYAWRAFLRKPIPQELRDEIDGS